MPDINDVYQALIKADAAGDKESAKQLADYLRQVSNVPAPKEEEPSALKTFAKRFGLGQVPVGAGIAGFEAGMAAAAPAAALAGPAAPVVEIGAGLVGGAIAAYGASKAQEKILESAPDLSKALGVDPATLAREEQANPLAAKAGALSAQLVGFRPSLGGLATKEGLTAAGLNAAIGGVSDVAQQEAFGEGPIDWESAAESAALGALLNKQTAMGRRAANVGRRLVGREPIPEPGAVSRPEAEPKTEEEKLNQLLLTYQPAKPEAVTEEVPVDRRAALEARMRELREATPQTERPKTAWETEFPEEPAPPEPPAPKKDMTVQRELPLGEEQMGLEFEPPPQREAGVPEKYMYTPAEEALKDLTPGTPVYKKAAKLFGLKLDRKGNLKPDQFVFNRPETEVAPGQEALDFNYRTPEERTGIASQLSDQEGQYAFDFPGVPMEKLNPRDQLLRAFDITEKRNIRDLADVLGWKYGQASREITALKKEGAVEYNPRTKEWSLTPQGEQRVYSRPAVEPTGDRGGTEVPVPKRRPRKSRVAETGGRGVEDTGAVAERVDEGKESDQAALERMYRDYPELKYSEAEYNQRRLQAIQEVQRRREQAEINKLRTAAADAYEANNISDKTYEKIVAELKKTNPNKEYINQLLRTAPKAKKEPVVEPRKVTLSENATDAEIAEFYSKTGGSKAGPRVKKEAPKFEVSEEVAQRKRLEAEAQERLRKEAEAQEQFRKEAEERRAREVANKEPEHPEWATKHEGDINGKVVYSDNDGALIRGHSIINGKSVYAAITPKGGRTRVDINSYTGDAFSPEVKQRLIDKRNELVAKEAELQTQNPDGPFANAKHNVVASDNINQNYTNFLNSLMKSMGLGDIRVFLLHPEDVHGQQDKYKLYSDYSSAMSAGMDAGEDGSLRTFGKNSKDFYISVRSGMSEGRTIETISHELGHLIQRVAYDKAPKATRDAIMAEYKQWVESTKGKNAAEIISSLRNRETAEAHVQGVTADTKLNDAYWRGFSEWFADNTSKWATTSEKPVGIVEKFFSDLAKKLREFVGKLTGNRFVPAKTVKEFLDAMGPGSTDAWFKERAIGKHDPFDMEARKSMSPAQQQEGDREFIQEVGKTPYNLPKATKQTIEEARNAASNVPGATRRGLFSSLNLHQLAEMYREVPVEVNGKVQRVKVTDALDDMWGHINKEGAAYEAEQKKITDNLSKWEKVMSRFSQGQQDRINRILLDTTAKQVEVLDLTDAKRGIDWKANKSNSLYNEFRSLHPDVRKMYEDLRLAYLDYARGVEDQLKQYMTPSEWQKMQNELNSKRLQVYLPLFRTGDYRLTYTDKSGEYHSRRFESVRERDMAAEEVRKDGGTQIEMPLENKFDVGGIPPTSFFGRVVGALNKNKSLSSKAKNQLIEQVVDMYMDYLPTKSVLQLARKREGTAGYVNNVLQGYANVAPSYARRLTNLEYMPKINESSMQFNNDMQTAIEKKWIDSDVANDLVGNVAKQMDYMQNPNVNSIASKAAYFSYLTYLGGNLSTAVVNVLDLPMVALSKLGGAHGFGSAGNKLIEAGRQYFNPNKSPELQRVIDRGNKEGVLRTHKLQDIANFKKYGEGLDTLRVRVERVVNWAFQKSDMFNRETMLLASYDLNKQKLSKTLSGEALENAAFKQAARDVYSAFGSSFPKAAPPLMKNGLAKTALTFKRYNLNRTWLLYKAFKEATANEPPEVRDAARKELLGYFGSAYVFAGVKGMPIVGAGMTLAALLNGMFGDKDDPKDLQEMLKTSVGMFNYKGPVNYAFNLDIASRTGWDGMFWRDDPKRMADVGPVTYAVEQFLGPTYSYAVGFPRAINDFQEGNYARGFEKIAPRVVGNISKSLRYATEGATTADGVPIVKNVSAYNKFMQAIGFAPDDITEARESAGAAKGLEKKIIDRRNSIIARAAMAKAMGDEAEFQEIVEQAKQFNKKVPTFPITGDSIRGAMVRHQRKMLESVNGVTVNRRLAPKIYSEIYNEEEEED